MRTHLHLCLCAYAAVLLVRLWRHTHAGVRTVHIMRAVAARRASKRAGGGPKLTSHRRSDVCTRPAWRWRDGRGGRGDPLTPLRAYKHTTVQSHSQAPCLAEYGPYMRTPFPRATVPRHAPTQTEPAGVRPHPPASKSKNREPLRPPQRFGAQPEPRAAAWGRTHAQEFFAARAYPRAILHRDRRGAHARSRAAPPRSTPACSCGKAAPRPSAHAIGSSSGAGARERSTLLVAAPMHGMRACISRGCNGAADRPAKLTQTRAAAAGCRCDGGRTVEADAAGRRRWRLRPTVVIWGRGHL